MEKTEIYLEKRGGALLSAVVRIMNPTARLSSQFPEGSSAGKTFPIAPAKGDDIACFKSVPLRSGAGSSEPAQTETFSAQAGLSSANGKPPAKSARSRMVNKHQTLPVREILEFEIITQTRLISFTTSIRCPRALQDLNPGIAVMTISISGQGDDDA